jgi:N-methylhydantoinase B
LGRTAFSPNIRDRKDYSCALFDARGELLGQATHIPVHLGSMAHAMTSLVAAREWVTGDILILNDPFQGGTHLPDITLIAPVFIAANMIGFVANRAHHADIGADAPGSMPVSRSIGEEGLLIPPTLLAQDDRLIPAVLDGLLAQLRDGQAAMGDFNAQVAAVRLGVRRMQALAEKDGPGAFADFADDLQGYGERLAAASLAQLPQGECRFTDYLDDDGFGSADIAIAVRLQIDASGVIVDFEGTATQVEGNLNCPLAVTAAAVFYVFRCLMPPQVPACAGAMRGVRLLAPPGSLVNAQYPAAVAAGNVETSMRIVDAICGALASVLPQRIPAAGQGTMNNLAMGRAGVGGWDYYETLAGGHGAAQGHDGLSARHSHMTNTLNTPVEVLERHYPLRIERYALRRGSGGAGQWRGGDGIVRDYRFLADADLAILSERRVRAPWGLAGGATGMPGRNLLDGKALGGKVELAVKAGQLLSIETPGGGGWGRQWVESE